LEARLRLIIYPNYDFRELRDKIKSCSNFFPFLLSSKIFFNLLIIPENAVIAVILKKFNFTRTTDFLSFSLNDTL